MSFDPATLARAQTQWMTGIRSSASPKAQLAAQAPGLMGTDSRRRVTASNRLKPPGA